MSPLRDIDIRSAARTRLLAHALSCPHTRVVEELGIAHGAARLDIAVINGRFRGIEIKAQADTLVRLPRQIEAYGKVVDLATLVAADCHIDAAMRLLPRWWGVVAVRTLDSGKPAFHRLRPEKLNRDIDPMTLARLLWHAEAAAMLRALGADAKLLRAPRATLYAVLATSLPRRELRLRVRETLKARESWRDRARPSSDDGLSPPIARC